jgi:hypothetical protein
MGLECGGAGRSDSRGAGAGAAWPGSFLYGGFQRCRQRKKEKKDK